jgi:hypothetical protein
LSTASASTKAASVFANEKAIPCRILTGWICLPEIFHARAKYLFNLGQPINVKPMRMASPPPYPTILVAAAQR